MSEFIKIIGIDCATDAQNVGLSVGFYQNGIIELKETRLGTKNTAVSEMIYNWIDLNEKVVLAIDAPLGWPIGLGQVLYSHSAGRKIDIDSNSLFRRETDRFVKSKLGKQPLDVGADRIARTAHAALRIIDELRRLTGKQVELVWDNKSLGPISVIEVYPAATLGCYGITSSGYKDKIHNFIRIGIVEKLQQHIIMSNDISILESNADALDSAVCLLAAKDFLEGRVYFPECLDLAKKEGWIWVRDIKK